MLSVVLKHTERISAEEEEDTQDSQGKLMYSNTEPQTYQDIEYKGRGRGNRYDNIGRGRGISYWESRVASKITGVRCDKVGQFAATCPDRLLKIQETT